MNCQIFLQNYSHIWLLIATQPFLRVLNSKCVCAQLLSCVWLWDRPMDCSLAGYSPWNFASKNTEQLAISFSRGSSQPRHQTWVIYVSCIGRRILYPRSLGSPKWYILRIKHKQCRMCTIYSIFYSILKKKKKK